MVNTRGINVKVRCYSYQPLQKAKNNLENYRRGSSLMLQIQLKAAFPEKQIKPKYAFLAPLNHGSSTKVGSSKKHDTKLVRVPEISQ